MSDVRNPDNFPDDISRAISKVTSIVAGFAGATFVEEGVAEDVELIGISVDQWGLRDFARYFSDRCSELHIPYVPKYARDVQSIKQIKSDLTSIGRASNLDLKAYIDWAFDNKQMIMSKETYFTLGGIQKYVNHFIQSLPDDDDHRPSWGEEIGPLMLDEYNAHRVMGLLIRFGIPLTAMFLRHAGFGDERISHGIGGRLTEIATTRGYDAVSKIAKQSINSSPYPDGFPLLNWRSVYFEIWDVAGCRNQTWWRDADYGGMPFVEYDAFLV